MAANDELPRGWTQQAGQSSGASETITFPAIPGIAWVLTAAQAVGNSGYTGVYSLQLEINGVVYDVASGNAQNSVDALANVSWSGQLAFPVDTAVAVSAVESGGLNVAMSAAAYPV